MATPPTVTEAYESSWSSTTSPKTSSSLTVTAGDVLVVLAGGSVSNGALSVSSSAGLTWTATSRTTALYDPVYLWTATVVTSGTLTVTVTRASGSSLWGFNVLRVQGAGLVGTPVSGSGSSGSPSLAITTTGANSAIAYISSDYNGVSVGSRTWRTVGAAPVEDYVGTVGSDSFYVAHYADAGTAGAKTTGLSAPTGQKWQAIAVELLAVTPVTTSVDVSFAVYSQVTTSVDVSFSVAMLQVTASVDVSFAVYAQVTTSVDVSFAVYSRGTWREYMASSAFAAAVADHYREVTTRFELLDRDFRRLRDLPLTSGEVTMNGREAMRYAGTFSAADPALVPQVSTDPLDPRGRRYLRVWWQVKEAGVVGEVMLATLALGRPKMSSGGAGVSITVDGADVLTVAAESGYGLARPDLGGMTVPVALRALFRLVAPSLTIQVAESPVVLPLHYVVGDKTVAEDWTSIAELAGWQVRSDADGSIICGPPTARDAVVADWQEGPDCPATDWSRDLSGDIHNVVVVVGTHPDVDPIRVEVRNDDTSSPTNVAEYGVSQRTIESDAVTTPEAATNIARMWLGKEAQGTEGVTLKVPTRPDLRYRDRVTLKRDLVGAAGIFEVASWRLPCPVAGRDPELMDIAMMTRSVR